MISACTELGAISALCDVQTCLAYRNFGRLFGLAFQVQDDFLGIWGDTTLTGKSNQSDLITRKKTLPILYGLSKGGKFAEKWYQEAIDEEEINEIQHLLEVNGGKKFTITTSNELITKAIIALDNIQSNSDAGLILKNLTLSLIERQV